MLIFEIHLTPEEAGEFLLGFVKKKLLFNIFYSLNNSSFSILFFINCYLETTASFLKKHIQYRYILIPSLWKFLN